MHCTTGKASNFSSSGLVDPLPPPPNAKPLTLPLLIISSSCIVVDFYSVVFIIFGKFLYLIFLPNILINNY